MDVSLITFGANAPSAALTLNRVALGRFFAIGGYLELFNASRYATLGRTLQDDGVRRVAIMQWLVPGVEFRADARSSWPAVRARRVRPFGVRLNAFALDAIKCISAWNPINRADWIGDVLYIPEARYWDLLLSCWQGRGALTPLLQHASQPNPRRAL